MLGRQRVFQILSYTMYSNEFRTFGNEAERLSCLRKRGEKIKNFEFFVFIDTVLDNKGCFRILVLQHDSVFFEAVFSMRN